MAIEWRVVGWRDSGALVDDVAARIERGEPLPSTRPGGPVT